ncbi:hypothetical protein L484_009883 [Morus notabilis]|uniref:Ycf3-interacting protein 1 n=1 Tax=Morus notabilis TaxID=981085 RepID=W9R4W6_9ROSA|nr:ycf3-interacting protein 1, chloroplastic [Morus notabilis]EXB56457.1 hypothetical protein L484_009883 [Morus notabilis]
MGSQMQILQPLPLPFSSSSSQSCPALFLFRHSHHRLRPLSSSRIHGFHYKRRRSFSLAAAGEDNATTSTSASISTSPQDEKLTQDDPDPQDLEYVRQIKRVLELLRRNRDMLFSEVKLTIAIEDPRDVERRRLLGIEDQDDAPTRDDLAAALEEVNKGKIPKNRAALRMLAEEIIQWPNLEAEATKKKPSKSLYARATDTGVDPRVAAKRLNIDWDTAAEFEDTDTKDESEVPPVVGYGALYLVTAFPVIIGISVVLILFYNSLQ